MENIEDIENVDNMAIWNDLSVTDPGHTKNFKRSGGFSGTALKPIWATKRMTETFGPCGIGWGMTEPRFRTINTDEEILVFCTVGLWHSRDRTALVYGVGGDKVVKKDKNGLQTSDESFKAAYTDALSNAMKQLGVGADIHMGLFEDNKYIEWAKSQYEEPKPEEVDIEQMKHLCRVVADKITVASMESLSQLPKTNDMVLLSKDYKKGFDHLMVMIDKRRVELGGEGDTAKT